MKLMAEQWIYPGIPVSTQKGKNMKQPDRHIYHLQFKKNLDPGNIPHFECEK